MEWLRNGDPCMGEFEVTHSTSNLVVRDATPIFEPCAKCGTKQKWGATSPYCRECQKKYNRTYYIKHQDKIKRLSREYLPKQKANHRKRKLKQVELKGGKCERCGYDKNYAALVFHHPNGRKGGWKGGVGLLSSEDPQNSAFSIDEVVLVCENCHKELHHPELQVLKVSP